MENSVNVNLTKTQLSKAKKNQAFQLSASQIQQDGDYTIVFDKKTTLNKFNRARKNGKGFRFQTDQYMLYESPDDINGGKIRWGKIGKAIKKATYKTGDALKSKEAVGAYKDLGKFAIGTAIDMAPIPGFVKGSSKSLINDTIDGRIKKISDLKGASKRAAIKGAVQQGKDVIKSEMKAYNDSQNEYKTLPAEGGRLKFLPKKTTRQIRNTVKDIKNDKVAMSVTNRLDNEFNGGKIAFVNSKMKRQVRNTIADAKKDKVTRAIGNRIENEFKEPRKTKSAPSKQFIIPDDEFFADDSDNVKGGRLKRCISGRGVTVQEDQQVGNPYLILRDTANGQKKITGQGFKPYGGSFKGYTGKGFMPY